MILYPAQMRSQGARQDWSECAEWLFIHGRDFFRCDEWETARDQADIDADTKDIENFFCYKAEC